MIYKAEPFPLSELKEYSEDLASAVVNYFNLYPKKITFRIDDKFTIRKHLTKINVFEVHRR